MKTIIAVAAVFLSMFSGSAMAYENFIPLGTGYSTDVSSMPGFESTGGQIIMRTDIYEAEIYRRDREIRESISRTEQLRSNPKYIGSSDFIDY